MKSLRNKVILSGIVLLFAFIATIGSTYAWFTVSTQTTVEGVDLRVTAADNLLIRIKHYTDDSAFDANPLSPDFWTTSISRTDLVAAGYLGTELLPWRLKPVTIVNPGYADYNAKTLSYMDNIYSPDRVLTVIDNVTGKDSLYNANGGYYIKLEFYLLSQSDDDQIIEIDPAYTSILATNAQGPMNAVANATRLSMWLGAGNAFVFGNDDLYDFDFTGGVAEMDSLADPNETSTLTTGSFFNKLTDLTTQPTGLATSVIDLQTGAVDTDLGTLLSNTPTLVTVLVYIEGWDAHANNDIVNALFTINFGFKFGTLDV